MICKLKSEIENSNNHCNIAVYVLLKKQSKLRTFRDMVDEKGALRIK